VEIALRPDLGGMRIFGEPLFGYASAQDPYYAELKKPGVIGLHFMYPTEWLTGANSVISIFLPFTEQVRSANRKIKEVPVYEWLHARIEGQAFQNVICGFAAEFLRKERFDAVCPMIDSRFVQGNPAVRDRNEQDFYSSNWSERHTAFIAGLGTFGLSRGIITRKGMAGRFISVITTGLFKTDKRPYTSLYDYCTRCGACAGNCPAGAISPKTGKAHPPCSAFLEKTREQFAPRYGCGKCQVKVPCEARIPSGPRKAAF
jgi:epoxyqueuosine reductase QueG